MEITPPAVEIHRFAQHDRRVGTSRYLMLEEHEDVLFKGLDSDFIALLKRCIKAFLAAIFVLESS